MMRMAHKVGSMSWPGYWRRHLRTPLYANAYYLMANTAIGSLLGFVFWTVVARVYPADDVGIASSVISAAMLLASLAGLGMGIGLIRFLPGAGDASHKMLDSTLTFVAVVSVAVSVIFLAGISLWSPALAFMVGHPPFLIGFVAVVALSALAGVVGQVFVAHRAARFTLLSTAIMAVLKIPLVVVFAALDGSFGIFASVGIAFAASLGVSLIAFLPAVQIGYCPRPRIQSQILHGLLPYSVGNYAAVFLTQAPQLILPIMVLNVLGAQESAYAYMVWMIANMLFVISGAIATSTFAEGSNEESLLGTYVRRALRLTLLLSTPAILAVLLLGGKLLLVFGRDYAEGGTSLLSVLALSALPVGINNIYFAVKRITKEIKPLILLSLFIAGGTLVWSYLLMPRYGVVATGMGWLVSQGMVCAFVVFSLWRRAWSGRRRTVEDDGTGGG